MPRSERVVQRQSFRCSRLGGTANVSLTFVKLTHEGHVLKNTLSAFDCEHHEECGVSEWKGLSCSFDWKKCVHPADPGQTRRSA